MSQSKLFKYRHYQADILLCLRWYLRYSLSYRDVEEMMAERGLSVDHTTIYRWVQRYAPMLEKRCRAKLKSTNNSWRVDETYVKLRGTLGYLPVPSCGLGRQHSGVHAQPNQGSSSSARSVSSEKRYGPDMRCLLA